MNVSVVVPTLNEEKNIINLFRRLLPQLEEGDEVIVVDGGSEDKTIEIAKKYADKVYIAKGASVGKSRGVGVEKADNEIIVSTDADALPPDGWVRRIRYHFEKDEDLAVLWGDIHDLNGRPIRNLVGKFSTVVGGASGNNTAFRKKYYSKISGYRDVSFMEDVDIINKLSEIGKAKRDKNLVMVMNMDRTRYQTLPMVGVGVASFLLGSKIDKYSDVLKGFGVSLLGTEMSYERFGKDKNKSSSDNHIHHDQIGYGGYVLGKYLDNDLLKGGSLGLVAHHALTEGFSFSPSKLYERTKEIEPVS